MNGCSFPTASPSDGFKPTSNPVTGVTFVDGSLITNTPSMSMPDTSCLSADLSGAMAPPTTSSAFLDVGTIDYALEPYCARSSLPSGYTEAPLDTTIPGVWSPSVAAAISDPAQISSEVHHQIRKRRRTRSPAPSHSTIQTTPLWDVLGGDRLARSANGAMIGETMMHIYHDVLEGALSCWLTEQTCPYNSIPSSPLSPSTSASSGMSNATTATTPQQQFWGTFEEMQREIPDWSNRIYLRVLRLDRMAHQLGLKRLSPSAERKVSTALHGAVMAFTAQWAQASQRSSARWPPNSGGGMHFRPPDVGEEFDRTLQKSFWNQARTSLDECGEIDSFRVVFAEIIFGLTQKYGEDAANSVHVEDRVQDGPESTSEVVEEILREDTQQIWLERATRRLHVLRRRVELYDGQLRSKKNGERSVYDAECRKTIDLLFWLAVMFDTISSAMTQRPLTVSDEDSSNLALTSPTTHYVPPQMHGDSSKRWNLILAKDQQTKLTSLRWPCTDADIARELADAAPVKVLLYRKVTRLQTLIARDMDARTLEEAICDALMVYEHWQVIYGAIFEDCLAHHVLLSSRTQSWYVCLFGHWLLATILLAELVDVIDERRIGGEGEARRRREEGTLAGIRQHTVRLVSDLARASTPLDEGAGPGGGGCGPAQLDGYHHAVNEGALLTEPWTMILLRTFSKTAILLLEEGERVSDARVDRAAEARDRLQRCEDCIKALWYLGRKSDMAREVANILSVALGRARLMTGTGHRQ
ncbi:unnamed protein product [Discula destructiva]